MQMSLAHVEVSATFSLNPRRRSSPSGVGMPAAEGGVELDRIARAAGGIDMIAQVLRGAGIEDVAGFLERGEGVGVQHLRPHIAVIGRGVAAAGEHVLEVGGAVAHDDFGRHADARERVVLEGADVERLGAGGLGVATWAAACRWTSRSTSADATYSTVAQPWLNVRAAMRRRSRSCGIGSPVRKCTAKRLRISGRSSQCS